MMESFESDIDPLKATNLLHARRFCVAGIAVCRLQQLIIVLEKYTCQSTYSPPTPFTPAGLLALYIEVRRVGHIHDAMDISNFLNPVDEIANDDGAAADQDTVLQ